MARNLMIDRTEAELLTDLLMLTDEHVGEELSSDIRELFDMVPQEEELRLMGKTLQEFRFEWMQKISASTDGVRVGVVVQIYPYDSDQAKMYYAGTVGLSPISSVGGNLGDLEYLFSTDREHYYLEPIYRRFSNGERTVAEIPDAIKQSAIEKFKETLSTREYDV